jgi:DNA-binding MarR family transcriptional regulator
MASSPENVLALLVADVYELAGALRRHGDALAGRVGQTQARWQVLSVVSVGDWTVPAVARRLGVTRQAVQRITDELEAEGLIAYVANPAHRRSPRVQLTAPGRTVLSQITRTTRSWRAAVASGLSAAEIERARRVLRSVLARVEGAAV